jgi:hypothetical protein
MKKFINYSTGLGLILLAVAAFSYMREVSFLKATENATGTVVDLYYSSSTNGGGSFCPVIDFNTKAGEPVRYYGNVCSQPPAYDIGDKIDVVYDPADIKHVAIDAFWSEYLGAIIFAGIGLPFFLLGVWISLAAITKNREGREV